MNMANLDKLAALEKEIAKGSQEKKNNHWTLRAPDGRLLTTMDPGTQLGLSGEALIVVLLVKKKGTKGNI